MKRVLEIIIILYGRSSSGSCKDASRQCEKKMTKKKKKKEEEEVVKKEINTYSSSRH